MRQYHAWGILRARSAELQERALERAQTADVVSEVLHL